MAKDLTNNQLLLRECVKQEYSESEGYTDESAYFEHFSISEILKDYNLNDDEIDNGITGGGNDGGCDGLYLFLNDELLVADQIDNLSAPRGSTLKFCVIQSKNELGFKEDAIMKWKTISENLLNMSSKVSEYSGRYNELVIDGFTMFRDAITKLIRSQIKIQILFYYISLGVEVHPNVIQQTEELKESVNGNFPTANVETFFVGANDLMRLYNQESEIRINLDLADQPISLSNKDYVALVNIGTYFKFITDESGNVRKGFFEANVRDYQGKNSVNTCIAETLTSGTDEDFWWLNNGVTILASDIALVTNKSLQLVNPEIVNGLQTSREIYNFYSDNPSLLESEVRNVLIRVIKPVSEESRDNIIFATNNQTNIPKSSLRVTDPIHLQIEMYFRSRGLYYDRRKNYYKNQKKKAQDIISVQFLAQCLISLVLRKPDFARARPSTLLTDDETYSLLYEKNHDLETFYKAARIGRIIQNNLKSSSNISPVEKSDILFYLIYGIVAQILGKKEISFDDVKSFDVECLSDDVINRAKEIVYSRYKELGGNGRVAKSSSFVDEVDSIIGL